MAKMSIAMAAYNGKQYIIQQLNSILKQTRTPDEVIISDDLSDDGTYELAEQWIADNGVADNFKLIQNEYEHGVYGNFYNAIKATSGDIILFCDQDDVWELNKIEVIEAIYNSNRKIQCLNTGFSYIDSNDEKIADMRSRLTNHGMIPINNARLNECIYIPFDIVINKNISPGMTMAVSRNVIDLYLRISSRKVLHDWEINCISAYAGGCFYLNQSLVNYRIHDEQTVSVGYLNKNIKNRAYLKIKSNRRDVEMAINIIEELISLDIENNSMQNSFAQMLNFLRIRYAVAVNHRWKKIPKLITSYCAERFRNKYMDYKALLVDVVCCFSNSN